MSGTGSIGLNEFLGHDAGRLRARSDLIAKLIGDVPPERFLREIFGNGPSQGRAACRIELDWPGLFSIMAEAHANRDVRYLTERSAYAGIPYEEIEAKLSACGASTPEERYRWLLDEAGISMVIQSLERYVPAVAECCECLAGATAGRSTASGFATPAFATTARIHYDLSEVIALHLLGEKEWRVHQPIEWQPNHRFTALDLTDDHPRLGPARFFTLRPGDYLYLPRGWIHKVRNVSAERCFHASVSVFSDSWISVLANVMDQAYERLRAREKWRTMIDAELLESPLAGGTLESLCDEFYSQALQLLREGSVPFLDHVRNDARQRLCVEEARNSLAILGGGATDAKVVPSGAQYLVRPTEQADTLRVSSNGNNYFTLPTAFWDFLRARGTPSVSELGSVFQGGNTDVAGCLKTLISDLGIYRLEAIS